MYKSATLSLANAIENTKPIVFIKYGDGEFSCIYGIKGTNCDGDKYNKKLATKLLESFKYLTQNKEVYVGAWHDKKLCDYLSVLLNNEKSINWCYYHSVIIEDRDIFIDRTKLKEKIQLFKAIKNSYMPKCIVCNKMLEKSKILFNADLMIYVPENNWFETSFDTYLNTATEFIKCPSIFIFCAGMSSKVLIAELYRKFPNNIYIDFGSALDLICTKKDSRGRGYTYDDIHSMLIGILPDPDVWNDEKYDIIYDEAKTRIGRHIAF